jgi:hypothetical protein
MNNGISNENSTDYSLILKLKEENKKLQNQLQRINVNGGSIESSSDLQYKNYLQEIVINLIVIIFLNSIFF